MEKRCIAREGSAAKQQRENRAFVWDLIEPDRVCPRHAGVMNNGNNLQQEGQGPPQQP
ncbi:unnamed protein product [Ectocarpus sp. CCAP 1310/34]|nr:unnamed protein product [Ectocarpus sp. CCAP 1310/34]